jgi:hypothetical protein
MEYEIIYDRTDITFWAAVPLGVRDPGHPQYFSRHNASGRPFNQKHAGKGGYYDITPNWPCNELYVAFTGGHFEVKSS